MAVSMLIVLFVLMASPVQSSSAAGECKNYCATGGTCLRTRNGPKCICSLEWTGSRCEVRQSVNSTGGNTGSQTDRTHARNDPCKIVPNFCENGGICHVKDGMYACHCRYPFIGDYCEKVSPCNDYCQNGGTCELYDPNFTFCACMPGWTGMRCDIPSPVRTTTTTPPMSPHCNSLPKDHCGPGTCVFDTTVRCACPPMFTGNRCQTMIGNTPTTTSTSTATTPFESCNTSTCKNGGRCFNTGNSFFCYCRAPYTGLRCEVLSTS